jgi:hypothetical protein
VAAHVNRHWTVGIMDSDPRSLVPNLRQAAAMIAKRQQASENITHDTSVVRQESVKL